MLIVKAPCRPFLADEFILFKYREEALHHRKIFLSRLEYGTMFVLWDMPTERTRYGNIVINDTNDGLPCK